MKLLIVFCVSLFLLLGGCASTDISANLTSGTPLDKSGVIGKDLLSAAYNLDNAVLVGALSSNDPAPGCVHGVLRQAGIEVPTGTTPPTSFTPKNDGVVSLGSIAYIKVQQIKNLRGVGLTVPVDCKALIGTFVIDGLTGPAQILVPVK